MPAKERRDDVIKTYVALFVNYCGGEEGSGRACGHTYTPMCVCEFWSRRFFFLQAGEQIISRACMHGIDTREADLPNR